MIVKPSCGDPLTAINRAFLSMEEEEEEEDGSVHMQQSITTMIYNNDEDLGIYMCWLRVAKKNKNA